MRAPVCVSLCVSFALMSGAVSALAQAPTNGVMLERGGGAGFVDKTAPKALLLDLHTGDPIVVEKGDYAQDRDWLRSLTLTIKNTSDRQVAYVEFDVDLPQLSSLGKAAVLKVRFGNDQAMTGQPGVNEKPLKPTKSARAKVDSEAYKALVEKIKASGTAFPTSGVLRLRAVTFDDGTTWRDGKLVSR